MDFPFGHHHQSRPEDHPHPHPNPNPNPNPYAPPAHSPYGGGPGEYPPPPPAIHHESHEYDRPEYAPTPPNEYGYGRTEYAPRPPPPVHHVSHEVGYGGGYGGGGPGEYPPPAVHHVSHEYDRPEYAPTPPNEYGYGQTDYAPPPPPPVQHVSHEVGYGGGYRSGGFENQGYQHQHPSPATHVEHVSHDNRLGELLRQPTVRIYTKAAENFSLSIREGSVVLVPSDPRDEHQHWIKDLKYSTRVKDEEGLPSFALVNKVTGQAIKHANGATRPVRLVPYKPDYLDESVLWTESKDTGAGFRCIRMVNNINLNFDAFNGDEDHGGVRDGTTIVLWEWVKGKNQRWKIVPY